MALRLSGWLTAAAAGSTSDWMVVNTTTFECRPEVWVGIAQGLYWEPTFAGSTDLYVDWSQSITENINLNVGWSGGALYDNGDSDVIWRTGPEVTIQYYIGDNAFIYTGVNYDVFESNGDEGGFRYGFGIGLAF